MSTQTVFHPWHGAHYGDKAPATVNALIEIPQGSRSKYEVDKETGLLRLDRVIYSSFQYPINTDSFRKHSDRMAIRWIYWCYAHSRYSHFAWWKRM